MAININEKVTFNEFCDLRKIPNDLKIAYSVFVGTKKNFEQKRSEWEYLYNSMLNRKTNYK